MDIRAEHLRRDPAAFADAFLPHNEKGHPWCLTAHQRRVLALAFQWDKNGTLLTRIILWSEPKKSGKTFLAAVLGLWWATMTPNTEIIVVANDLEQAVGRVFRTMVALLRNNPALEKYVTVRNTEIQFKNGTVVTAIASDYRGAAGSRHSLVVFDELWGFSSENAQRFYEELTPPPTEPSAWVLIVTYAGFQGESKLLESLYRRGLAGERIDDELEIYRAGEMLMFWSHTPRQPWQTDAYFAEQRRSPRPSTYLRLHENRWAAAESTFITPELWDACVEPEWSPLWPTKEHQLFVGVDAATKQDSAAVVGVLRDESDGLVVLACHRIWYPSPDDPLDLEETVEAYLRELDGKYSLAAVLCDPYQLHRSITTLRKDGLPVEEFPQTMANVTRMGQTLFDLLKGKNLITYPAADLREQAMNTIAVETSRGWRLAKERQSRKIDAIVALAMACVAALDAPVYQPLHWVFSEGLDHGRL